MCNPGSGVGGGGFGAENSLRKSRNFTRSSTGLTYLSLKILQLKVLVLIYTQLYLKLYITKVLFTLGTGEKGLNISHTFLKIKQQKQTDAKSEYSDSKR